MQKKFVITLIVVCVWLVGGIIASFYVKKGEEKYIPVWKQPVKSQQTESEGENMDSKFYSFTMKSIDGTEVPLSTYKGKVVLVVNVASKCGYTSQYAGLQELYEKYKDQGLVILGFPANNFASQEPGTNEEIKSFCTVNFGVTFPMFAKISVKGDDIDPLYAYLTSEEGSGEHANDIKWNFNKYLIDKTGKTIGYFSSGAKPMGPKITKAIEAALNE